MTDDFIFPSPTSPRHSLHKAKFFGDNNKSRAISSSHSPINSLFSVCSSLLLIHGLNQVYTATILIVNLLTDAPVEPKTRQFALCSRKCVFSQLASQWLSLNGLGVRVRVSVNTCARSEDLATYI